MHSVPQEDLANTNDYDAVNEVIKHHGVGDPAQYDQVSPEPVLNLDLEDKVDIADDNIADAVEDDLGNEKDVNVCDILD